MPWFKVDDNLAFHHKVIAAGNPAMGLWVRAGAFAAQQLTDGFIPSHMIPTMGTKAQADKLVSVGLWEKSKGGYTFHEWGERQPTRAETEERRSRRAEAGRKGGQASGRSRREANASPLLEPPSRPDPTPPVVTESSQSQTVAERLGTDGLDKLKKLTKGTEAHVIQCAEFVLSKAPANVRDPAAYVAAAIRDEPDAFRFRRGNPKKGEDCPIHTGQWADACAGCAADRKASK